MSDPAICCTELELRKALEADGTARVVHVPSEYLLVPERVHVAGTLRLDCMFYEHTDKQRNLLQLTLIWRSGDCLRSGLESSILFFVRMSSKGLGHVVTGKRCVLLSAANHEIAPAKGSPMRCHIEVRTLSTLYRLFIRYQLPRCTPKTTKCVNSHVSLHRT